MFGSAQRGINSLKSKFAKGKKAESSELDKEVYQDSDLSSVADKKDGVASVKTVEA